MARGGHRVGRRRALRAANVARDLPRRLRRQRDGGRAPAGRRRDRRGQHPRGAGRRLAGTPRPARVPSRSRRTTRGRRPRQPGRGPQHGDRRGRGGDKPLPRRVGAVVAFQHAGAGLVARRRDRRPRRGAPAAGMDRRPWPLECRPRRGAGAPHRGAGGDLPRRLRGLPAALAAGRAVRLRHLPLRAVGGPPLPPARRHAGDGDHLGHRHREHPAGPRLVRLRGAARGPRVAADLPCRRRGHRADPRRHGGRAGPRGAPSRRGGARGRGELA